MQNCNLLEICYHAKYPINYILTQRKYYATFSTKSGHTNYIYDFIINWLNREALFIFWMIVLNLTVVKLNVGHFFISRSVFRVELFMFACDFSIISFMVIFLDSVLYFSLGRFTLLHKAIKYTLLGINLCMFLADIFTLYNYGVPFNEVMLDVLWMTNIREAAEFMQIYFMNFGLWLCFGGVLDSVVN